MSLLSIRQKPIHRGRIPTPGGGVYAASPSQADVAAAVAAANAGDTVYVPAGDGTETWTQGITLARGLNIVGPGAANLTLSAATATFFTITPNATALSNNEAFRIIGFTFDGNERTDADYPCILVNGPTTAPILNKLIIGECGFVDSHIRAIACLGQVRGVIYGNTFHDCSNGFYSEGGNIKGVWDEFGPYRGFGLADGGDSLFFEDNTITCSDGSVYNTGCTTGQCGRGVIRYNTWDVSNGDNSEHWDIHGSQYFPSINQSYSTLQAEYYGNTLAVNDSYRWINARGGWVLIHNNVFVGEHTSMIQVRDLDGSCDSASGVPGQIDNAYFWNNTCDGTEEGPVIGEAHCGDNVLTDNATRYHKYNAAFDGDTQHGIGRGTNISAAPASATAPTTDVNGQTIRGDAFWVATTATPTVDSAVIQAGKLYKFIDGSWQVYYEPYTYPHPLRSSW